jgi:hypothetical protein
MPDSAAINLVDSRHPGYLSGMTDWRKWRLTYDGGDEFREIYLEKFSGREDQAEFNARKAVTPVPRFAGAAINDIRNAIYQRMRDITRKGGSKTYQNAVNGLNLGVDRRGATMNAFVGVKVLTELLVMGRVGVFVDAPLVPPSATLANTGNVAPYLYRYDIEDILSWTCSKPEEPSEFQAVLLRDTVMQFDQSYFLPTVQVQRYRYLWINPDTGKVNLQFYDIQGAPVDQFCQPSGAIELELTRIPFVMLDIGNSLIKDVCGQENESLPTKRERPCPTLHGGRFAGGEVNGRGHNPGGTGSTIGRIETRVGVFTRGRKTDSPRPLARNFRRSIRKNCCRVGTPATKRINALAEAGKARCCVATRDGRNLRLGLRAASITESAATRSNIGQPRHYGPWRQNAQTNDRPPIMGVSKQPASQCQPGVVNSMFPIHGLAGPLTTASSFLALPSLYRPSLPPGKGVVLVIDCQTRQLRRFDYEEFVTPQPMEKNWI